jgi:6 kDa early secretory antigenic target
VGVVSCLWCCVEGELVFLVMESMSVRPEQVVVLSGQIRSGAQGIRSSLDDLDQKVGVLRSQWSGESQASYDVAQRQWNESISAMQQLLEKIASSTEQMSESYTSSDRSSARRFGA